MELRQFSNQNKNYNYILNCIDIFSRFAWAIPLKDKKKESILEAFKKVLEKAKKYPEIVMSDKESGIRSKVFMDFCKKNNIHVIHPKSSSHAPFIEVFNRSQKNLLYKYFTENKNHKWINVLDKVMQTLNHRFHRIIR